MLTIDDCLLTAAMELLILFLVLLDQRHEIKWPLLDENDLAILDASITVVFLLHNATLAYIHRLEEIVSTYFD